MVGASVRSAAGLGLLAAATATTWLSSAPLLANAACECGYLDPATNALWTDAAITYFNETGTSDMVTNPAQSPKIYGQLSAGDTGSGSETWAVVGDHINDWEESFGATYRSAVSYNTTYIDQASRALAMEVSPANLKHRIVNGSSIVTRRRDILYGSFRAQIQPPTSLGRGAAFKFGASWNESETVDVGIYTSNLAENSTLRWSYSASGHDADPVQTNLTWLDTEGFVEHRFDWLSDKLIQFRNDAPNATVNFYAYEKGTNASNIPTVAAPISFQAWANGERSQSQGPPINNPLVTRIMYTRFFFNSSLTERHDEFDAQCQASGGAAVCSTEDLTLRERTAFVAAATAKQKAPKWTSTTPLWSGIMLAISGGVFIMTIAHGLVVRRIKAEEKRRLAAIAEAEKHRSHDGTATPGASTAVGGDMSLVDDARSSFIHTPAGTPGTMTPVGITGAAGAKHAFDRPFDLWASPDLVYDSDSDSDSSDDDDVKSWYSMDDARDEKVRLPTLPSYSSKPDLKHAASGGFERANGGTETPRWVGELKSSMPYVAPGYASSRAESLFGSHLGHGRSGGATPEGYYSEVDLAGQDVSGQVFENGGNATDDDEMQEHLVSRRNSQYDVSSMGHSTSMAFQHEGSSRRNSVIPSELQHGHPAWQQPRIIQWQQRDQTQADGEVGQLAKPEAGDSATRRSRAVTGDEVYAQKPLLMVLAGKLEDMLFSKGSTAVTSTGARRIDYLDGMRGFAAFLVSFHHFMLIYYYGITTESAPKHYPNFEIWFRNIIGPLTVNQGLKLGIFFVLPSRTMCNRYLLKGGIGGLADTTVRRLPRLALPTAGAVLANYFLMDVGGFKWVPRLASRTWSTWSYWQNFPNVMVFLNAFISLWWASPPDQPALVTGYATGVLWTIPVIVQGTWTSMTCALIAHEIKNPWKRFSFYAICVGLSWYANTWDVFFMAGLIIADLDLKLNYQVWAKRGFPLVPAKVARALGLPERASSFRVQGQVLAWILFLACCVREWLACIRDSPMGSFDNKNYAIHPDWQTSQPNAWLGNDAVSYTSPRIGSWVSVMALFAMADLNDGFRRFFRFKFWTYLGKHSFAVFLCHGIIFWTWSAWLCLNMLKVGAPYWATILVVVTTSYALLMLLCECFTRTFDYWGGLFSKSVWRATSGGYNRKD
ncbi:uncharacterized protein PFL1_05657 [Pseudozyma flocculosa PF-1]|uniref:Acyltransferase 3 domain-containing protein n=2 Tax=Pseudozyma flocculosa TaxID=84751 RepID=A0A5C3FDC8_9BASI|nr:uncharacterized protein PFL1_05657 [Pseudozyma flocculosa PF-1]EPQ26678.1 hypothetical protein PFL1_05657 [Pseudozyma flocculosa PF-1]SPO42156.1 uncharacterized protein PSFLO_07639 [Pseudozyma flocculosa]